MYFFFTVCVDTDDMCCFWASLGHCDSNMFWMRPYCQRACGTCGCANHRSTFDILVDNAPDCKVTQTECMAPQPQPHSDEENNKLGGLVTLATGTPFHQATGLNAEHTEEELQETTVAGAGATLGAQTGANGCDDTNELCCFWASIGHCDSNKYWMRPYCQKSCGTCDCTEEDADSCQVDIADGCQQTTLAPFTRLPQTTMAAVYSSQATIRQMPYQALNGGIASEASTNIHIEPSPPAPNADTAPTAVTNPAEVPTKAVKRLIDIVFKDYFDSQFRIRNPWYNIQNFDQSQNGNKTKLRYKSNKQLAFVTQKV
uniref:ShKT domain-containing protein n=1 Tax=Romanomermis culicivorax TaxID=13658 RepID=A0A915IDI0_ROMCU